MIVHRQTHLSDGLPVLRMLTTFASAPAQPPSTMSRATAYPKTIIQTSMTIELGSLKNG